MSRERCFEADYDSLVQSKKMRVQYRMRNACLYVDKYTYKYTGIYPDSWGRVRGSGYRLRVSWCVSGHCREYLWWEPVYQWFVRSNAIKVFGLVPGSSWRELLAYPSSAVTADYAFKRVVDSLCTNYGLTTALVTGGETYEQERSFNAEALRVLKFAHTWVLASSRTRSQYIHNILTKAGLSPHTSN
jgi:hypothetical protein